METQFFSVDGLAASVPIDTILRRGSEVMIAYEMNDEEIPAGI
jgi:DMSO/TMAO reductase YedYZ molybdopterin-dependent catalytic subunit